MLSTSISKYDKTTMPAEVIDVEASKLDDTLAEIQIKYHTCLRRGVLKGKHVTRYMIVIAQVCLDEWLDGCSRLCDGSKRSGCSFHLNVKSE